jgi:endonuclease III
VARALKDGRRKPPARKGAEARASTGPGSPSGTVTPPATPDPARRARVRRILATLARAYPDARCALNHRGPLDLYVATVLSAQCTDERVNQVTPALFSACRRPEDYLALGPARLEEMIRSTGFYRNKAKSILGGCRVLRADFDGEMPGTMEDLLRLPGVGRKTANVILGEAFDTPGITVDTHVGRLARRLGLTVETDPVKVEFALMPLIPQKDWTRASHLLICHGRECCGARKPECARCPVLADCPYPTGSARATG